MILNGLNKCIYYLAHPAIMNNWGATPNNRHGAVKTCI